IPGVPSFQFTHSPFVFRIADPGPSKQGFSHARGKHLLLTFSIISIRLFLAIMNDSQNGA
ncbi:MAG: hypothetical protein WBN94_06700, partial [Methanothrix sp.]